MAGVLLRTAGGTLLFVVFLWLVRIDDYRVAGMMLTFPMLNGIGLLGAGENAERQIKSMLPVITLNGAMCFLFALALAWSETARAHPLELTLLATALWVCVYAVLQVRNDVMPVRWWTAYTAVCVVVSIALTLLLWPPCTEAIRASLVRADGIAGLLESWVRIVLFAGSLLFVLGFAHFFRDAHAAVGRLGALPIVPLFGLYTVASVLSSDPAAVPKLETMRSMVLIGWMFALLFAVLLAAYVARTSSFTRGTAKLLIVLLLGWALCVGAIAASARLVPMLMGCAAG